MMNATSPERVRQDCRLIGQTLLKLALPRLLVRAVVLVVAAIVWLLVASWLLSLGQSLNFENLPIVGQDGSNFLQRALPYARWGVVVIWTLIIFFIARAWVASDMAAARARPVPSDDLADLVPQLSDEVVAVLRWVWGSRDEPFTLGDLRQALAELRHSRIGKLDLVRQQADILDGRATRQPMGNLGNPGSPATARPTASVPQPEARPAGARIEPNL